MDNKLLNIKSFKTIYSALLTKVEGLINKSNSMLTDKIDGLINKSNSMLTDKIDGLDFKSDWNQNDENADNYIKNRPFYEEDCRTETFLDETIIDGLSEGDDFYQIWFEENIKLNESVVLGEIYTISWDGVEYSATLQGEEGGLYFGINYYYPAENPDNLPFGIWLNVDWDSETDKTYATEIQCIYTDSPTSASHTIAIYKGGLVIKKIDEKYLPDSVMESEVVVVTRKADDWDSATYSSDDIYDLSNEGRPVVFVDSDMTYHLTYSEVDPTSQSTFVSIWQNKLYTIKVTGVGWIEEEILDIGSIDDANLKIEDIELNIDLKMDKANPVGTGSFSMNRKANSVVGNYSNAMGYNSASVGEGSTASGKEVVAVFDYQNVYGKYNKVDDIYEEVVSSSSSFILQQTKNYYIASSYTFDPITGIFSLVNPSLQKPSISKVGMYACINDSATDTYIYLIGESTASAGVSMRAGTKIYSQKCENVKEYAHIIGNGESEDARSNAHTLDWDGNAWFSGDVYVGSTSGTNRDDGSKKLATEDFVNDAMSQVPQADWNQNDETAKDYIKNKPFGETTVVGDTLYWDGNTEGKILTTDSDGVIYAKVSDMILQETDFVNGCSGYSYGEKWAGSYPDDIVVTEDIIRVFYCVYIVNKDGVSYSDDGNGVPFDIQFPEKGIYFMCGEPNEVDCYVKRFTIPGFNGFERTEIKKIPAEYLPDGVPYEEERVITILKDHTVEANEYGSHTENITVDEIFKTGDKVIVSVYGKDYECIAEDDDGEYIVYDYYNEESEFGINSFVDGNEKWLHIELMKGEGDITIRVVKKEIHKIPEKYLPSGCGEKELFFHKRDGSYAVNVIGDEKVFEPTETTENDAHLLVNYKNLGDDIELLPKKMQQITTYVEGDDTYHNQERCCVMKDYVEIENNETIYRHIGFVDISRSSVTTVELDFYRYQD